MKCWKIHFAQKALIARNIIIKNNPESSVLEFFFNFSVFALLQEDNS